jgi:hypothetical protein
MGTTHTVQAGETLLSLGLQYGFHPEVIWEDTGNGDLRSQRSDMNELQPGDRVVIPDLVQRSEAGDTGQRHRFRRVGVPARLRLQVLSAGQPIAQAPYTLIVDEVLSLKGSTDAEGMVDQTVPANAVHGLLLVEGDGQPVVLMRVLFGGLDPVVSDTGAEKRLRNLGFWREDDAKETAFTEALRRFQRVASLPVTGLPDTATRGKLEQMHDSSTIWSPDDDDAAESATPS